MDNVKMKIGEERNTSVIAFRILLAILWSQATFLSFITEVIERLPIIGGISDYLIPCAIVVSIILSIPVFLKRVKYRDLLFYIICAAVVFTTIVFFEKNAPYVKEQAARILLSAIPFYFVGIAYFHEDSKKDLFWCSLLGVAAVFAYQFYCLILGRELMADNMSTSYNILPSILYLIYYAFDKKKWGYWLLTCPGIILAFVFGTRGPILCIAVYILVEIIIRSLRKGSIGVAILMFGIIVGGSFLLIAGDSLVSFIKWLEELFESVGFSTRIFDMFLEGDIANSTGRDVISEKVIKAIWENPFLGYGLMGDRVITDTYVHNIALELWCSYGIIIGTVLLAIIIAIPLKALIISKAKPIFNIVLLFTCMMLVKLMLSGSYPVEPYFYMMLGLSIGAIRSAKAERKPSELKE